MKFNYGKIFLLGFGFFGVSVIWGVYNAFVPIFLSKKFGLAPVWIGFFMTLDNIAALFIQPAIGAWSDRVRTKIGRRMPFILVGAPISAAAFGWIPLASVLPLFVAGTVTLLLSMALWRTPVVALMPDVTPSSKRSQANGIVNFMGGMGFVFAALGGAKLYEMNPSYPFWMGSVLVLISALMLFIFIREHQDYEESDKQPDIFASLQELWADQDKSAIRLFWAILFWFIGYNAIEAFFTLYAINHLGMGEADGARLLGHLSLLFVLSAIIAGFVGGKFGRRNTIMSGILLLAGVTFSLFLFSAEWLVTVLTTLPILGDIHIISIFLMLAGVAWAMININSLPMVVDMVEDARIGTYTGLYYLFSTLAAIIGPNLNGLIIQVAGNNYNSIMLVAPTFMLVAFVMMIGVKRGEAKPDAF